MCCARQGVHGVISRRGPRSRRRIGRARSRNGRELKRQPPPHQVLLLLLPFRLLHFVLTLLVLALLQVLCELRRSLAASSSSSCSFLMTSSSSRCSSEAGKNNGVQRAVGCQRRQRQSRNHLRGAPHCAVAPLRSEVGDCAAASSEVDSSDAGGGCVCDGVHLFAISTTCLDAVRHM